MSTSLSPGPVADPDLHRAEGSTPDLLADDDDLRKQLDVLARDNQQLLASLGLAPAPDAPPGEEEASGSLEAENQQLRVRIAELEKQLASPAGSRDWTEQQKEYEALLEEKSEVIRTLHQKVQELRDRGGSAALQEGDEATQRNELQELSAQLEAERDQLRQDEASVMQQMTQMEMTMARERAEMARQRNELQRLHTDIRHELDVASRDSVLRERLATFHRRHQEVSGRKSGSGSADAPVSAEAQESRSSADTPLPKKNTGILRRIFG